MDVSYICITIQCLCFWDCVVVCVAVLLYADVRCVYCFCTPINVSVTTFCNETFANDKWLLTHMHSVFFRSWAHKLREFLKINQTAIPNLELRVLRNNVSVQINGTVHWAVEVVRAEVATSQRKHSESSLSLPQTFPPTLWTPASTLRSRQRYVWPAIESSLIVDELY